MKIKVKMYRKPKSMFCIHLFVAYALPSNVNFNLNKKKVINNTDALIIQNRPFKLISYIYIYIFEIFCEVP